MLYFISRYHINILVTKKEFTNLKSGKYLKLNIFQILTWLKENNYKSQINELKILIQSCELLIIKKDQNFIYSNELNDKFNLLNDYQIQNIFKNYTVDEYDTSGIDEVIILTVESLYFRNTKKELNYYSIFKPVIPFLKLDYVKGWNLIPPPKSINIDIFDFLK
jgi:hypothetical protein